jgi:hypothetical protein
MLTAQQVVQRAAQCFVENDEDNMEWLKQVHLWGLRSIYESAERAASKGGESLIGKKHERFEFVDTGSHPLLREANLKDHYEDGDIFGALEVLVNDDAEWNRRHNLHNREYRKYPEGHIIKFWGKDDEFYIILVATNLWHFQKEQCGVLFRRVKLAEVVYTPHEGDNSATLFLGPDAEALEFAKRIAPDLHEMTEDELMGLQGCSPMGNGGRPWYADFGMGMLTVSGYQF